MKFISVLFMSCCALSLAAQKQQTESPYIKFGKITVEELQKKSYAIDSSASAVVLSDIGDAAIEGNSKGWFSINFHRHKVVHILNKNGYSQADVEVPLYTDGNAEELLQDIRAVTYNLENGKIVETRLDKGAIFKDKKDKNLIIKKFTLPNVKEGSIVEFQYSVQSDFIFNLDPWSFQAEVPTLWSEYNLTVPSFFQYAFLGHGYLPMYINDRKQRQSQFTVRETRTAEATEAVNIPAEVTDYRWAMKDVPEFREENYTSSARNHISRIDFQLTSQSYPLQPHDYVGSWAGLTHGLLEAEGFGSGLKKNNGWLSDDMKTILSGASTPLDKAKKIYDYLRTNFTCTNHSAIWAQESLKNIMKAKKGSVAEVNLLLTAMLTYAGLQADPVLVSTRSHGYALEQYPILHSFNYVISRVQIEGVDYYLDASHTNLGFARLLPECYNGHARIVDEFATPISLSPDSLRERSVAVMNLSFDEKDKSTWIGTMTSSPGYFESYRIREKIGELGKDGFFKDIRKVFSGEMKDMKLANFAVDSLSNNETPLAYHYDVTLPTNKEDILYVNPMFGEGFQTNPFKSQERNYPVEMPYTMEQNYIMNIAVPEGYMIDELPKSVRVKLDEKGSGYFEYLISQSDQVISMRSVVKFNRTLFLPDEYDALREFFNLIVKKHNEQIVFKKKK